MSQQTATSEVPVWIERKFPFDFPVELYPNLRVRVRGTPARLEELTRGLSRDVLTRQVDGKWSILENAGHLLHVEQLWSARVDEFLAGAERLTPANFATPRANEASGNVRPLEEILAAFRASRTALADRLEGLPAEVFARVAHHPRLNQPMRLVDHLCFIAEHDDQHLARIWELRQQFTR
jgi:uncharacterized damage-inducible protein DinB